ncbi:tetraacyldisaccharide 4'-kinase [Candidatus Liberibacter asiaticus]|uniref:Tetraacyldisaccharide 4'-kinase n=2 Tax=Liberibacter asiaticus TaxID=34021 RepID=C6XHY1_LIBAP|nr:tetraacyldisaccharide 4'-kinase [Candidatus Liberibacter asiaticus]ACT56874.1 tetraacyldisaccharide 4'-kinase [Candidatus Liberibacter asiaticus str. psy62]AGH16638.1 tetraacyldisaccharide 4'-kinase [Candidatus Liberibacter asiaticus str. gxpsy]ALK07026.1 tetraacyldisaccharide 4'-kinase [Candidatus Liberibacter asiaticus]ASK52496.1 tetraacyldisaccharide 4'-kinase [Candidatus Liberibacter asiaticus]AWL13820.1 tetraacyldisaccharide 4'-kinase [Candidatus Liberibacter asiaticus]
MMKSPLFWWKARGFYSFFLYPISWIYSFISSKLMKRGQRLHAPIPVICVGGFVMGGTGKTPTALAIAKAVIDKNLKPGFLSRGYGRKSRISFRVDLEKHSAYDVGDEPLLLARRAVTIVTSDRKIGVQMLLQEGVDIIIMDDGFHSADLQADFSLIVVNSHRGLGNGLVFPAGPLRVPLSRQLSYVDAILYVGNKKNVISSIKNKSVYFAKLKPRLTFDLSGKKVLAFSGIADTEKFFTTVRQLGALIEQCYSFGDHAHLSDKKIAYLLDQAQQKGLILVTTAKDAMRLHKRPGRAEEIFAKSMVIEVDIVFENPDDLTNLVEMTVVSFANSNKKPCG